MTHRECLFFHGRKPFRQARHSYSSSHQAEREIKELGRQVKGLEEEQKKTGSQFPSAKKDELTSLKTKWDALKKNAPAKYPTIHALEDSGSADMRVALRGNLNKHGEVAPRRFLRILAGADPPAFRDGSGRLELAKAMVSPDNPLTARVLVNRVWMHHFGKAIVRTPDNFGLTGQPPTHPDLLDWLALDFVQSGWSIKQLHRRIMLSASYQMGSQFDRGCFQRDSDNLLLWRMNPRRLDVEAWRDGLLAVSGGLDRTCGGPAVEDLLTTPRRTLYSRISRSGDLRS